MSQFDLYAAYYDLLYKDKDYSAEVDYLSTLIKRHNSNDRASTLLELGCGTGGHAQHFAERGWKVHGIDLSKNMISRANARKENKKNIRDKMTFEVGDVRSYSAKNTFDVIMSLFHVMSYQVTDDDLISTFTSTRKNLKEGGLFIFDFWYGPGVLTDRPKNVNKVVENNEIIVNRKTTSTMMINKNCVDVGFDIEIKSKISKEKHEVTEHHTMRYWFLPELQQHLSNTGFKLLGAYQWMTLEPMTENTWYGCTIAQAV